MSEHSLAARLEQKADDLEREAKRYRVAAEVVRQEQQDSPGRSVRRAAPAGDPRRSTRAMLSQVASASAEPLDLETLTRRMLEAGWQTDSAVPVDTVRTAASRLAKDGELQRVRAGVYAAPTPQPASREAERAENEEVPDDVVY